jgi:hypothetical protein
MYFDPVGPETPPLAAGTMPFGLVAATTFDLEAGISHRCFEATIERRPTVGRQKLAGGAHLGRPMCDGELLVDLTHPASDPTASSGIRNRPLPAGPLFLRAPPGGDDRVIGKIRHQHLSTRLPVSELLVEQLLAHRRHTFVGVRREHDLDRGHVRIRGGDTTRNRELRGPLGRLPLLFGLTAPTLGLALLVDHRLSLRDGVRVTLTDGRDVAPMKNDLETHRLHIVDRQPQILDATDSTRRELRFNPIPTH